MQDKKKRLNVVQSDGTPVIEGITCFSVQDKLNVNCQRKQCQHWISHSESNNCVIIAAQQGPRTLQEIGRIYGLTRMRICQIEKSIYEKIRRIS